MFKVLTDGCEPTKGTKYSAAVDLYASEDAVIGAGKTKIVGLGVCIDGDIDAGHEFAKSHYLQLEPRSSLRSKGIQAGTGIIDLDYPDEIKIILHRNYQPYGDVFKISKGDRIAQVMLCEHKSYLFGIESKDDRTGGIGST